MSKTRTMYMHTLDGKPASLQRDANGSWLYFVSGRNRVQFASSLSQIRREQNEVIQTAQRHNQEEWSREWRYGYVLVEVPA